MLVIPEIAELEAAASGGSRPTPRPPRRPSRRRRPPPCPPLNPASQGRELTEDGLPDVSALFMGGAEPARPEVSRFPGTPATSDLSFEEELPADESIATLDLAFPVRPSRPLQEIADAAAAFVGEPATWDETAELQAQRRLHVEQLAALQATVSGDSASETSARAILRAAVAAGRAAERLAEPDATELVPAGPGRKRRLRPGPARPAPSPDPVGGARGGAAGRRQAGPAAARRAGRLRADPRAHAAG